MESIGGNMRLIPVDTETSIPTRLRCASCGHWFNSGELYADLDGTPFQAYYCRVDSVQFESRGERVPQEACANKLIEEGARVVDREYNPDTDGLPRGLTRKHLLPL